MGKKLAVLGTVFLIIFFVTVCNFPAYTNVKSKAENIEDKIKLKNRNNREKGTESDKINSSITCDAPARTKVIFYKDSDKVLDFIEVGSGECVGWVSEYEQQFIQYGDKIISAAYWQGNRTTEIGSMKVIKGCEKMAVIQKYKQEVCVSDNEKGRGASYIDKKYWVVFLGEKSDATAYILCLDAERYSKEETISIAKSIRF